MSPGLDALIHVFNSSRRIQSGPICSQRTIPPKGPFMQHVNEIVNETREFSEMGIPLKYV